MITMTRADAERVNQPYELSDEELTGLNDWAVNELRDEADAGKIGWLLDTLPACQLGLLIRHEQMRVRQAETVADYAKVSRAGSTIRLSRRHRYLVFVVIRTQDALRARHSWA